MRSVLVFRCRNTPPRPGHGSCRVVSTSKFGGSTHCEAIVHARHGIALLVDPLMTTSQADSLNYLPRMPARRDIGIGVVGAGFIVRECHLVAYASAGFRVVGIT